MVLVIFASFENNLLVRLEAKLGLSPAPLERFLGVKNLFSGMTEGVHRLVLLDISGSFEANIFAPLVFLLIILSIMFWRVPKLSSRSSELTFFGMFMVCSFMINLFNN